MSNYTRRNQAQDSIERSRTMLGKVEREIAEGYVEVEIGGIALRRLACVYSVIVRNAWAHTLTSVRSLVRVNPAH
jgi:hypothetical protein